MKIRIPHTLVIMMVFAFLSPADILPDDTGKLIPLLSREGIDLLQRDLAKDFQPLRKNWVAQKKSHCGAASAVMVHNALRPRDALTQDSLFTPETDYIITQEIVYRLGFTLEELAALIQARSGFLVEVHHASDKDERSDHEAFIQALKANRASPQDHVLLNFSRAHLEGKGTGKGHWSPVADYNEEKDRILVMEVNAAREPFWVSSKDIYQAMHTIDKVSNQHRGWLVVRSP